jgi:hypothetical protein
MIVAPGQTTWEVWDQVQMPPNDSSDKRPPEQRLFWMGVIATAETEEEAWKVKEKWEGLQRTFPTTYHIFKVLREIVTRPSR